MFSHYSTIGFALPPSYEAFREFVLALKADGEPVFGANTTDCSTILESKTHRNPR